VELAVVAAILAFAPIVRLYKVTASAIWFDEAVAITFTAYPRVDMFDHLRGAVPSSSSVILDHELQ
jgi:hypothetical protein